jgi:hypothetical protein
MEMGPSSRVTEGKTRGGDLVCSPVRILFFRRPHIMPPVFNGVSSTVQSASAGEILSTATSSICSLLAMTKMRVDQARGISTVLCL